MSPVPASDPRAELANAIFEWIEALHNPGQRYSTSGYCILIEFENLHTTAIVAARRHPTTKSLATELLTSSSDDFDVVEESCRAGRAEADFPRRQLP